MEWWHLAQAKLGDPQKLPLRHVAQRNGDLEASWGQDT